ncbi:MAG: hypothetical protein ACK5XL_21825, partial [Cyclobacteriaceae bacterium]
MRWQKWFRFGGVRQKNVKTTKKTYAGAQTNRFAGHGHNGQLIFVSSNVTAMIAMYLLSMVLFFTLFSRLAVTSQSVRYPHSGAIRTTPLTGKAMPCYVHHLEHFPGKNCYVR